MVTRAALELGIDARPMQQGAQEASRALDQVTDKATKTARAINLNTESIERKLDAIVDGIAQSNKILVDSQRTVTTVAKETEQALVKTEVASQKFGREIVKAGGVAESVERKFASLGKAATGMFAVDIASKVLGFSSAMDVLQKATQGVADALHAVFGFTAQEQRIEAQKQMIEKATEFWDGLRMSVKGYYDEVNKHVITYDFPETQARILYPGKGETPWGAGRLNADDFTEEQRRSRPMSYRYDPPSMSLDTSGLSPTSVNLLNERILELQTVFQRLSDPVSLRYGQSNPGFAPRAADFERQQQEIYALAESLRRNERFIATRPGILGPGYTSLAPSPPGSDEWFIREAQRARSSYRPDLTGFYAGDVDASRRSLSAAEQIALNWQRNASLNTSGLAYAMGFGGIGDSAALAPGFRGPLDIDPAFGSDEWFVAQGRRRDFPSAPEMRTGTAAWLRGTDPNDPYDTGYIGALQNRYSPERIAEQFSANFYQSLEASVMTGDFSNFGRSVMQMIGQSLMESLVAAPIQEAMASLMQALLGGIRGGFGGGGAIGQGSNVQGPPVAPGFGEMQAGGASTSVAPYRSGKQRYDDLSRRNLR